ncbi:MAG TPA: hypothetical protein VK590_11655 [Saprospiraceae bacterium]|nr:hypothetical protein [Saprospiraceae bacterium]
MQKKSIILGILLFINFICYSQTNGYLYSLNTTGYTKIVAGTTYNYSVGETVAFSNSCSFTHGVIQPTCVCIVSANEVFDQTYNFRIYPSPTFNKLYIETDFLGFENYLITSIDGTILINDKFIYTFIDLDGLPPAVYFLILSSADNKIRKTIKIIKL